MEVNIERSFEMSSESATGSACCLVLLIAYYTAHIAIGAVYLGQCPRQPYIPIYLLVLGCFCMVQNVLSWCLGKDNIISAIWNSVTGLFILCWYITGNVWIYSIYEPNYDKTLALETNSTYCDKTVYQFAFWTTILPYIILALCPVAYCCFCLFGLAFAIGQSDPDIASETMGAEGEAAPPPPGATPPCVEGV